MRSTETLSKTDCAVPQALAKSVVPADPSSKYSCKFEALVCTFPTTNKVTATLHDNDNNQITKDSTATVTSVSIQ